MSKRITWLEDKLGNPKMTGLEFRFDLRHLELMSLENMKKEIQEEYKNLERTA